MPLSPVPDVPEIVLHTAHPGSGLRHLIGDDPAPPYWAYQWAGGTVLARHLLDHPEILRGRRVLDLGAGSGIVGIAACLAGASEVRAAEIDANGRVAIALNAAANKVRITISGEDLLNGLPPDVELILIGDLFYAEDLASRVVAFLDRCLAAGIAVLVGDPYRTSLPQARLRLLAEYNVRDVGNGATSVRSGVFAFAPKT